MNYKDVLEEGLVDDPALGITLFECPISGEWYIHTTNSEIELSYMMDGKIYNHDYDRILYTPEEAWEYLEWAIKLAFSGDQYVKDQDRILKPLPENILRELG